MAVAIDSVGRIVGANLSATWNLTFDNVAGDLLLVGIAESYQGTPQSPTGVTYNGVAMTRIDANTPVTAARRLTVWALGQTYGTLATGSNTLTATYATSPDGYGKMTAVSLSGTNASTPTGTVVDATGTSANPSVNASSAADEIVVDFVTCGYAENVTALAVGAGQTAASAAEQTATSYSGAWAGSSYETGAGTTTMSWTPTGTPDGWLISAVPVKPAAATTFPMYAYAQQ